MAKAKRDGFYKRLGSEFWYTRDPRTDLVRSTKCRDLVAAKLTKGRWEREAADPAHAAKEKETLHDACERLIRSREELGKSTAFHEAKLGTWLRIFGDDTPLSAVGTPAAFDKFIAQRRAEGVKNHTIVKEINVMTLALRASIRVGCFNGDTTVLRPPDLHSEYVPRKRSLSHEELTALLSQLTPERAAFVALCVGLGLRKGETLALRPEHVDLERGTVFVPGTKTALARRTVPILDPFRGLITSAVNHLPLNNWQRGNYLRDLAAACRRAGIPRCTPNDFRRTHATLLRNAGVDPNVVRGLLGHSAKSNMLERVYDQPTPQDIADRVGPLPALTRQLEPVLAVFLSGRAGLRSRDIRLVRTAQGHQGRVSADLLGAEKVEEGREGVGSGSRELHSPAAHALAMAFVNVTRRGAA